MNARVYPAFFAGLILVSSLALSPVCLARERVEPGETLWPGARAQQGRTSPDLVPLHQAPPPPPMIRKSELPPEAEIEPQAGEPRMPQTNVQEKTQDAEGVLPSARRAVISGRIKDVDPRELTITYRGRDVKIKAGSLVGAGGNLHRYYDEDMWVTVEGILDEDDEITATSIAQGDFIDDENRYYDFR